MENQIVNIKFELERINCGLVNWKGTKQEIRRKMYIFWAILTCVVHVLSESESFHAEGRAESALVLSCYVRF